MKLYINDVEQWAGTIADAKALGKPFKTCEVPTDKAGLLAFLNNRAHLSKPPEEQATMLPEDSSVDIKPVAAMPLNTVVGQCSLVELKELSTTLRALLFRTWSETEKHHDPS